MARNEQRIEQLEDELEVLGAHAALASNSSGMPKLKVAGVCRRAAGGINPRCDEEWRRGRGLGGVPEAQGDCVCLSTGLDTRVYSTALRCLQVQPEPEPSEGSDDDEFFDRTGKKGWPNGQKTVRPRIQPAAGAQTGAPR